jgi:galactokinase
MLKLIEDKTISKRARHVITENQRVREFAQALASHDLQYAGKLMNEGHQSLTHYFDTSTPTMDKAVEEIQKLPGVFGARMTGGGFGGCVVALCSHDANVPGWTVSAVGAARLA